MTDTMNTFESAPPPATPPERVSAWEYALAAVVLAACLLAGLALADTRTPAPAVGVLRFASEIDFASASHLVDMLEAARRDDGLAAVVLEVSSPGGFATSSESIFYALLSLREAKPLVVVVDGLAASGGYYMAAAGNRIYAPPSSYVGNVGTRGGRPNDPSLASDELSSGPYKLEGGSRFDQIHQLDLVRNSFLTNVVNQRTHAALNPLTLAPEELAEARIYLGSEAVALGIIDGEGGRPEGIKAAAELAGLTSYDIVDVPAYLGMEPIISGGEEMVASAQAMLAAAPPGTIFALDSRIPFPEAELPANLQHLRKPRAGADFTWRTGGAPAATFAGSLAPAANRP